jgi:F-type H+-transporting ATPase subunit a
VAEFKADFLLNMNSVLPKLAHLKQLFFIVLVLLFSMKVSAHEPTEPDSLELVNAKVATEHKAADHTKHEDKVNIQEVAFDHVLDAHSWHLWGDHEHPVSFPLPVILKTDKGLVFFSSGEFHHDTHGKVVVEKNGERFVNYKEDIYYASESENAEGEFVEFAVNEKGKNVVTNKAPLDFSITKNAAQLIFSAIILILLFTSMASAYKKTGVTSAPKGKQSFLEPFVVFVRDEIAKSNIGPKYEKYVPYLLTVFFLILINNVFGLIPISANVTGNIAFTFVLSVITLIVTNVSANKAYWGHIFLPPAPKALYPILIPIEIVGIFTKPFALMIRLFANMTAGHIIVISLVGLIFVFQTLWVSPVAVAFALFIDILEVLVAVLQAYIFTLLTALFIGSAMVEHHHEDSHEEAGAH